MQAQAQNTDGIYFKLKNTTGEYFPSVEADPLKLEELVYGSHPKEPYTLFSAFAGKDYCFKDYLRGVKGLPLNKFSAIWYDNSNSPRFRKRLINTGKKLFKNFKVLIDETPPKVVESTDQYKDISWRCHEIYRTMQSQLNGSQYTMVVEDDTEIPKGTFNRLKATMESDKRMGTVVGSVASRRLKDRAYGIPILWKYTVEQTFPANGTKVKESRIINEKQYGIELVGASHMACWLTKTPLIKKIGFKWCEDGIQANDQVWGYRLNKAGYWHAVDWSVKCKHWHKYGDKVGYN